MSAKDTPNANWISFHIFYHDDRNVVLKNFALPVIARLRGAHLIDSFFFIRYSLGGPHVRLRLLPSLGYSDDVREKLCHSASRFFAYWPSTRTISEEVIRAENRPILLSEPNESDAAFPDNSTIFSPLEFETDRYGGHQLLGHSIKYFAISSAAALTFVNDHINKPWSQQLPILLRSLARSAWAFASDAASLLELMDYFSGWREAFGPVIQRADSVFENKRSALEDLVLKEFELLAKTDFCSLAPEIAGAKRLLWEIRNEDIATKRCIAISHVHMTANRLGLKNQDEMYLSQLLCRVATALTESNNASWRKALEVLTKQAATLSQAENLNSLAERALDDMTELGRSQIDCEMPSMQI